MCPQEEKIAALQSFADQLIAAGHYAKGDIASRRNEVLDRWVFLSADDPPRLCESPSQSCSRAVHISSWFDPLRWRRLKAQMIEKRSKLGESQTLQQFSRDVDEIEAWISEKLQTASDESYKDPTNIQVSWTGWPLPVKQRVFFKKGGFTYKTTSLCPWWNLGRLS